MLGPSALRRFRMIRPTDNLRSDHLVVARGLAVLAAIGDHVRNGGAFPAHDCAIGLRFLREFVIPVHLHKEASVVCPALAMHGSEDAARLVGEVLRLHDEIVELTHSLVLFWEPTSDLSHDERIGFADTVDAVVARLRRLERMEEADLLPWCDQQVPVDDQLEWVAGFERIERDRSSRQVWAERLAPLAASWVG